jgi:hypothetical protein
MENTVIIVPDWVPRVICQRMAYCATDEPKIVKAWPLKNRAVFFFQFMLFYAMP